MKQTRVFVLLLILVVAGYANEANATLVDSNSVVKDGIEYYIQTDKSVYNPGLGEEVQMLFRVTNLTANAVDLGTVFGAQSWWYDFLITDDSETEIWWYPRDWPLRVPTTFHLDPYESKQAEKPWGLINDNGTEGTGDDFPVDPGTYNIQGAIHFVFSGERVPVSVSVEVVPEPGTIYVDDDGPADFDTIQAAIDDSNDGDTIVVMEGTYKENIHFKGKNIILTSTDPVNEDIVSSTIIDGNDANSVVTFSGAENSDCVLRGFTIINGKRSNGAGILGNATMAIIENNVIRNNTAWREGIGGRGFGGGLYDCDGLIQNNIITGNAAMGSGDGGGLCGCDGMIRNNVISYNSAYWGGGLYECHGTIINNLLVGGVSVKGGALAKCNGTIRNCTIVGNFASGGSGLYSCNGTISNCIIWQNGAGIKMQMVACSTPIYSCIEDSNGEGLGNITYDPCFVHMGSWMDIGPYWKWTPDGEDYHLLASSCCIDTGDPNFTAEPNETDLDGNPRIIGGRIDMGAYEYSPPIEAKVNIRPRIFNLAGRGRFILCGIRLPEGYDVNQIEPNSILLEEEIEPVSVRITQQGQMALVRFQRSELQDILDIGWVELLVSGELTDGTIFEGTDRIRLINKKGKNK